MCTRAHPHPHIHRHARASRTCVSTQCAVFPRCSQRWSSAQSCCRREMPHFMQHRAVICAGVEAPSWHDSSMAVPVVDRCCHPDSATRPPTRHWLSAQAKERLGPCRERDPDLATSRTANHQGPLNCVALGGRGYFCLCCSGIAARRYQQTFLLVSYIAAPRPLLQENKIYFYFAKIAIAGYGSPQKCFFRRVSIKSE